MKNKFLKVFILLILTSLASCGQSIKTTVTEDITDTDQIVQTVENQTHNYGGWYCPDNLGGFPAVDIADWKNVPVIHDRLATKEETQTASSLIFVDSAKYPNAKPLDMIMPKLAKIYNQSTDREELIIVIQAINVDNDSVVGFRYLNGGNGSAWLNEITILSDKEIEMIPQTRFVSHTIEINSNQDEIWKVLTDAENAETLLPLFDKFDQLSDDWRESSNVNYNYQNAGALTAAYADKLYGCFYIQNDYDRLTYTEKFFLLENQETGITEFKIVCGPFADDFETQNSILKSWGQEVKELSEIEE